MCLSSRLLCPTDYLMLLGPRRLAGYAAGEAAEMRAPSESDAIVQLQSWRRQGTPRLRGAKEKGEGGPPVPPTQLRQLRGETATAPARSQASKAGLHRRGRIQRRIVPHCR